MTTCRARFGFLLAALLSTTACGEPPDDPAADYASLRRATTAADPGTCRGAPYPIILAHGMAGWEKIGPVAYFFGIADDLRARGETVFETKVPPFDSSAVRGTYLASQVDAILTATGACKVNLIGHSQGGLDGRYLISTLKYGDRVASLTTVSTPHLGSPVADAALGLVPGVSAAVINAILDFLYGSLAHDPGDPHILASLHQLSRDNMSKNFNPANPDDARVKYYSVAGRSAARIANDECSGGKWPNSSRIDLLDPLLVLPDTVFALVSPNPLSPMPNDGLVSISSAKWGTFLGCEPADHLDEIGQLLHLFPDVVSGFDHKHLYEQIVAQLHHDGL